LWEEEEEEEAVMISNPPCGPRRVRLHRRRHPKATTRMLRTEVALVPTLAMQQQKRVFAHRKGKVVTRFAIATSATRAMVVVAVAVVVDISMLILW
jgi:hypothetical protein